MDKSFIKGFICGVIAIILMILFIKMLADAADKEAEIVAKRNEAYASEMEAERHKNEGLPR